MMNQPPTKKLVWDLPLRLFHWLFGLSIIAAWITAETGEEQIHMWIGYFILGLLIFRITWGLIGTQHSLFWNFLPGPRTLMNYVRHIGNKHAPETVGHNPLGSLMVVLMLVLVGVQAVTGLFTEGEIWAGPYTSALGSDELTKKLEGIHHSNFNFILILIVIHVVAVLLHLLVKKQNLITPMISGKKRSELVPEGQDIPSSKLWLAVIVIGAVGALVYWLVFVAPPPVEYEDYYY